VGETRDGGGGRMLITRGDANDTADPDPVIEAQVRGVVVYAVPVLGYPGTLVSGETRSLLVAAVGAAVVLYGVAALVVDLVRSRRAGAAGTAAVVVATGVLLSVAVPAPPASAATADPAPPDALLVSLDGRTWTSGTGVALFGRVGGLAPDAPVTDELWVRNGTAEPAEAALTLAWEPLTDDAADAAVAAAVTAAVDGTPVAEGRAWSAGVLPPGGSRRLTVTLSLTDDAPVGTVRVLPVVRLSQHLPDDAAAPLPPTGGTAAVGAAVAGAAAIALGFAIRRRSRVARRP
jgi:hypothetical protein